MSNLVSASPALCLYLCNKAVLPIVTVWVTLFQPPLPYAYEWRVIDPQAELGPLDFGQKEARDAQVGNRDSYVENIGMQR